MTTDWNVWAFDPGIVAGLAALTIAYALAAGRYRRSVLRLGGPAPAWMPPGALRAEQPGRLTPAQALSFYGGILVAAIALLSPLHVLGERYLLSAHMVQHLLLTLVVAPLLLFGTPGWMLRPFWRFSLVRSLAANVLEPLPAFVLFNLVFVGWHIPALYELALHFEPAHALEHGCFLALGLVSWWPVLGSLPEAPRAAYGLQVLYLFFMSLPPTILGAIISLAEKPIYATYWAAPRVFGLEPLADQQLGGLIMWLPGAFAYFIAVSVVWFIWLERRSEAQAPPYGTVNPDRAKALRP